MGPGVSDRQQCTFQRANMNFKRWRSNDSRNNFVRKAFFSREWQTLTNLSPSPTICWSLNVPRVLWQWGDGRRNFRDYPRKPGTLPSQDVFANSSALFFFFFNFRAWLARQRITRKPSVERSMTKLTDRQILWRCSEWLKMNAIQDSAESRATREARCHSARVA